MATFVALESREGETLLIQEEGMEWPLGFAPLVIGLTEDEAEAVVRKGAFDFRRRSSVVVSAFQLRG